MIEIEKQNMLVEAGYRCEYCKKWLGSESYQREHILPFSKGGLTVRSNVAISCSRCNRNKGERTRWKDPFTGMEFELFDPRRMRWGDHFLRAGEEIKGMSGVGRATCALLFRDTSQYVPHDLHWDKIMAVSNNKVLYNYLNHLRYHRLRNNFEILYQQLNAPLPPVDAPPTQIDICEYARKLLLLELYFTRSKKEDIVQGIRLGQSLLKRYADKPSRKSEVLGILSILYQQRATKKFVAGFAHAALSDQKSAYKFFLVAQRIKQSSLKKIDDLETYRAQLRMKTLERKYFEVNTSLSLIREYESIPVIYTKACYRRDRADMGLIPEFFEELKRREILIDDQEGTQIVDELAPRKEDFLIRKVGSYSAFYNTALESILRNLGIDTIVITGGGSNVGCDSTARDAHSRGIKVIFLEDATSAIDLPDMGWGAVPHDVAHKVVCTIVARCIGQVMKSEDLIKKLG